MADYRDWLDTAPIENFLQTPRRPQRVAMATTAMFGSAITAVLLFAIYPAAGDRVDSAMLDLGASMPVVVAVLFGGLIGAWLTVLGVGMRRARRWAHGRAPNWTCLTLGVLGVILHLSANPSVVDVPGSTGLVWLFALLAIGLAACCLVVPLLMLGTDVAAYFRPATSSNAPPPVAPSSHFSGDEADWTPGPPAPPAPPLPRQRPPYPQHGGPAGPPVQPPGGTYGPHRRP